MKRYSVVVAALAAMGVAGYVATQLIAQQPVPNSAPAAVKFGMVNLLTVLKNYNKQKVYTAELDKGRVEFENKVKDIKGKIMAWQEVQKNAKNQQEREKAEEAIKAWTRSGEDMETDFKKTMSKKVDEMQVQMFKEIEDATKRMSLSYGFHAIFLYSEPPDTDKYSPRNVERKMTGTLQTAGVTPLYVGPGIDVSDDVVRVLNTTYSPTPQSAVPPKQ